MAPSSGATVEYATSRPRVLGWLRSAALLDGDWGTSIAYVLGIGFTLASYSSYFHLFLMLGLTTLVALNYIIVCRLYPHGGGVYSSVYHRSRTLAVIGALLLGADYVITIALSVLDAFHYLGVSDPLGWTIGIILCLGFLNWYGPKHSGSFAVAISSATLLTLLIIILFSAPAAFSTPLLEKPKGGFFENWGIFVGIILSISGIEAISNMTGLMKQPDRDSKRAILAVLTKVILATVFLGLAMHAVPGLTGHTEDMVRFLGEYYVGPWFGWVVAIALGALLISAANTAVNGLISVQFLMSVDRELPAGLRRLNKHGVPILPLLIATLTPITVLLFINDILTLAQLYAIGVVGAVLINIGSTATDYSLGLSKPMRLMMLVSAVVLFFVETSIAVEKPKAALFVGIVLAVGLGARTMARRGREGPVSAVEQPLAVPRRRRRARPISATKFLVAVGDRWEKLVQFAIDEAKARKAFLVILRVKEIAVGALPEKLEIQINGQETKIEEMCRQADIDYQIISIPSNEVGYTIAEHAAMFGVERVMMGASRRGLLENALKGNVIRAVNNLLPEEIQLVIFGS